MTPREAATAAVFVATFLLLALGRIGRRDVPRGPAALVGGVLTAVLWRLGTEAIDWQVILLLASLMALAGLAGAAGAFRGLQSLLARLPPAWALGAAVAAMGLASAVLLNDAAVVVLVPLLLPSLQARGLRVVPSVVLLAVAANAGSILTPFGNPQNAVLARAAGLRVPDFLADQALVALVAAASLAVACWREGRRAGPATPMPSQAAPRGQWRTMAACATLLALASLTDLPLGTAAAIAA
ncbi:MAG TPA: SLC13 family permease, partial [Candidatus Thermoplasmatota archaeon]|nr:SLC13 family permease [Candidatus Thermoplasmatota archaeon]